MEGLLKVTARLSVTIPLSNCRGWLQAVRHPVIGDAAHLHPAGAYS
jgi:hypothetical protein